MNVAAGTRGMTHSSRQIRTQVGPRGRDLRLGIAVGLGDGLMRRWKSARLALGGVVGPALNR